jgi:MFS family permease
MLSLGTPQEWRGAAIGLSAGANAAGTALGQLCGSAIASTLGIRTVFWFTSGVLAIVCVTVAIGIREPAVEVDDDVGPSHSPIGTVATPAKPRQG